MPSHFWINFKGFFFRKEQKFFDKYLAGVCSRCLNPVPEIDWHGESIHKIFIKAKGFWHNILFLWPGHLSKELLSGWCFPAWCIFSPRANVYKMKFIALLTFSIKSMPFEQKIALRKSAKLCRIILIEMLLKFLFAY